jgi:sugar phosphate isomerase/epimerase
MKIAVSSYSFNKMIQSGEIKELDTISLAKELGFDGIEFVDFYRPEDEDLLEYATKLRKEADRVGIPIVNYCVEASFAREGEDFDKEVEKIAGMYQMEADKAKEMIGEMGKAEIMKDLAISKAAEFVTANAKESK